MATISRDANGLKRILFVDGDKRPAIHLGDVSMAFARTVKARVEALLTCKAYHAEPDPELAQWVADLPDETHAKFAKHGLIPARASEAAGTLGDLLDRFDSTVVVKAGTKAVYKQASDSLRAHFGDAKVLRELTPADADEWRRALADEGLAPATIAKRIRTAKGFMRKAVRWGILSSSPFADVRAGSQVNADRLVYVSAETVAKVIDACPSDEWRAIIALSRFAGLRCPSEIVGLTWGDVAWDVGCLTVRSPKTAGEGHAVRTVPIAPALRAILQRLFDKAEPGAVHIVPELRDAAKNLRTHLHRLMARAGVKPWPRAFHNMRASCACDFAELAPGHVAAAWLGHSPLIAARHYLAVRDHHVSLVTGIAKNEQAGTGEGTDRTAQKTAHAVAQMAAQQAMATSRKASPNTTQTHEPADVAQHNGTPCNSLQNAANGPGWIRTSAQTPGKSRVRTKGGADSGALGARSCSSKPGTDAKNETCDTGHASPGTSSTSPAEASIPHPHHDADLSQIIAAWATLPPAIKAGVVALVKAAGAAG